MWLGFTLTNFIMAKNTNNSNTEANEKRVKYITFRELPGFASIFLEFQKSVALLPPQYSNNLS